MIPPFEYVFDLLHCPENDNDGIKSPYELFKLSSCIDMLLLNVLIVRLLFSAVLTVLFKS